MHCGPWISLVAGFAIELKLKFGRAAAALVCILSRHSCVTVSVRDRYHKYALKAEHA